MFAEGGGRRSGFASKSENQPDYKYAHPGLIIPQPRGEGKCELPSKARLPGFVLTPLIRKTQPYAKKIEHKAIWAEPELLVEIKYRAKSAEGKVRHPIFKGLGRPVMEWCARCTPG